MDKKDKKVDKKFKKSISSTLYLLTIVALIIFGGFYFKKYYDLKNNPADPNTVLAQRNDTTLKKISKLYDLPKGEQPQFLTVKQDPKEIETLKKQYPALSKAEANDYLLIYTNAKVAILYRPSTDKIVSVIPVADSTQNLSIALIGPETPRKTAKTTLQAKFKDRIEVKAEQEAKHTRTAVVVVDVSGKQAEAAKQIAEALGGTVSSSAPIDEAVTTGDIAVFLADAVVPTP